MCKVSRLSLLHDILLELKLTVSLLFQVRTADYLLFVDRRPIAVLTELCCSLPTRETFRNE